VYIYIYINILERERSKEERTAEAISHIANQDIFLNGLFLEDL
jgi:hypothetical protein